MELLFISDNGSQENFTKTFKGLPNFTLRTIPFEESFKESSLRNLTFVDVAGLGSKKATDFFIKQKAPLVLVTSDGNYANLKTLGQYPFFSHLIAIESPSFESEVRNLIAFFQTKDNQSLINVNWQVSETTIFDSDDRHVANEKLRLFVESLDCFTDFAEIATTAMSELLSNAFHDAPRHPQTNEALYPKRTDKVVLSPPDAVRFRFGTSDDNYLWLKVEDTFGTFRRERLIKALERAAVEKKALINSAGGAGLGLLMMFNWSTAMYFFIENKNHTQIYCKFMLTKRRKIFSDHRSHLHIL